MLKHTYLDSVKQQLNTPSPLMGMITTNSTNMYDTPAPQPSFGRLVRIPIHDHFGNLVGARDVTVKEARQIAKRHRKAAKRIEKALD